MQRPATSTIAILLALSMLALGPAAVLGQGDDAAASGSGGETGQLLLDRTTLTDPAAGGMASHTLLLPEGWDLDGGPVWTPQMFRSFVHLDLHLSSPDGLGVSVFPGAMFSYVQADGFPPLAPGGIDNGTILMPVPESIEAFVTELLMPSARPSASDVRVVDVEARPETVQMLQGVARPITEGAAQNDQLMGTLTEFGFVGDRVRVAYTEDGSDHEEDLYIEGTIQQTFSFEQNLGNMVQSLWWVGDISSVRAPAGELDAAKPLLEPIRLSIQRTPDYAALIFELNARLVRQEAEAIRKAGEIWADHQEQIRRDHGSAVASQQATIDDVNEDFIDYIRDTEDYTTTDGDTVTLPAYYDRVFSNGLGDYILTNDQFFEDADWTRLQVAE